MAFRFPIRAYTRAQLDVLCNPASANQPEAIPHVLFDTQLYTDNVTIAQQFYQAINVDKTLCNMAGAGQLPEPQYFQVFNCGIDVLAEDSTTSGGIAGVHDDINKLIRVGHPAVTLTIAGKRYIDSIPATFFHTSGGATGFNAGTWTAEENIVWADNSIPDGGWCVNGSIIIPPKQAFDVTINWAAAVNISGNQSIRFWMAGVLFRRVL